MQQGPPHHLQRLLGDGRALLSLLKRRLVWMTSLLIHQLSLKNEKFQQISCGSLQISCLADFIQSWISHLRLIFFHFNAQLMENNTENKRVWIQASHVHGSINQVKLTDYISRPGYLCLCTCNHATMLCRTTHTECTERTVPEHEAEHLHESNELGHGENGRV